VLKLRLLARALVPVSFTMFGGMLTLLALGLDRPAPAQGAATGLTFTKATAADQKAIAAQKVCKVSGESLGSMGVPIKVTRGDRSVYLCCASCEKAVKADPDKFLGTAITTGKAAHADQPAIAKQKTCPSSGEPLGSMGVPVKVTRGDRSVFLCCQSCLKTVLANPDKFLGTPGGAATAKK
jgi:hypothetical protein